MKNIKEISKYYTQYNNVEDLVLLVNNEIVETDIFFKHFKKMIEDDMNIILTLFEDAEEYAIGVLDYMIKVGGETTTHDGKKLNILSKKEYKEELKRKQEEEEN